MVRRLDDGDSDLVLWTIQPLSVYHELEAGGVLRAALEHVDPDYRMPYQWMAEKMSCCGVRPKVSFPLWAWHTHGGQKKRKPDLRSSWLLPSGTSGVRLQLCYPRRNVLLSQFEMWVAVLNNSYIPENYRDDERFDHLWQQGRVSQQDIRVSWDRIFDLSFGDTRYWAERVNSFETATLGN